MHLTEPLSDGPRIPFVPGYTEVPQGLGYCADFDEFVYTFYDYQDSGAGVCVFADAEGHTTARVDLRGLDHYGGVAVGEGVTYVCGAGKLQLHATDRLRAGVGEPLHTVRVQASSTVTLHRDQLYLSRWVVDGPGVTWCYERDDEGKPISTGESFVAPPQTQGMSIDRSGNVYYSRSWGRTKASLLTRVDAADYHSQGGWTPHNGRDISLPPMAEGSVIVDGRLYQLYESGATGYRRHRRPRLLLRLILGALEPRDDLTVHDLAEVFG